MTKYDVISKHIYSLFPRPRKNAVQSSTSLFPCPSPVQAQALDEIFSLNIYHIFNIYPNILITL